VNAGGTMTAQAGNWVARLQQFARVAKVAAQEHCELCAAPIAPDHPHLAEPAKRRLLCVCRACALLLGHREDRKYRPVPEQARILENFRLSDAQWDAFSIPIGLAFFFHSTAEGRIVAFYPGPAGPTESLLDLTAWSGLLADNPVLAELEPDVEALLVNRVNGARDYYAVPIDRCYGLVGLIRGRWQGVSGGRGVWTAIDAFFNDLREQRAAPGAHHHG
jgi:hypothetical protein